MKQIKVDSQNEDDKICKYNNTCVYNTLYITSQYKQKNNK